MATREKGFTLIELLVVIAVVAVMIGMLVPAVQAARQARNESSAAHTLSQIAYRATAINQGQTGVRGFGGDAGGILAYDCAPLFQWSIEGGEASCVPDSTAAARRRVRLGERSGVAAVDRLNALAGGTAVDGARAMLRPEIVDEVLVAFDASGDGAVGWTWPRPRPTAVANRSSRLGGG